MMDSSDDQEEKEDFDGKDNEKLPKKVIEAEQEMDIDQLQFTEADASPNLSSSLTGGKSSTTSKYPTTPKVAAAKTTL